MIRNNLIKLFVSRFFIYAIIIILSIFDLFEIGGIKFGYLWKSTYVFGGLIYVLYKTKFKIHLITLIAFLIAFKNLINTDDFDFYLINQFLKAMFFPITFELFIRNKKTSAVLFLIPEAIILGCILVYFEFIPALGQGYRLSAYEVSDLGFVGIFQNPHDAAMTLAWIIIIFLYKIFYAQKGFNKYFQIFLLLIGITFLYKTYVRTGLVMMSLGILMLIYQNFKFRNIPLILIVLIASGWLVFYKFQTDETFRYRITDTNAYNKEESGFEQKGSGRIEFLIASWEIFQDFSFNDILVGIGFKKQQEFMDKKVGISVGSHNFYMDMLIQQGIIGFLLLLWFLYMLYKIIKNSVKNNSRKLAFTLFYMYLTMSFFQGGYYFWIEFTFAISIATIFKNEELLVKKNNLNLNSTYDKIY